MFLYDGCSKRFDYNVLNLTRNLNDSNLNIKKSHRYVEVSGLLNI